MLTSLLGRSAPAVLADKARAALDTLLIEMRVPPPVELVALAKKRVAHCQRSALLRTICPTRVPLVRAPYLSHLSRDLLGATGRFDVFDLERGAGDPEHPERNRPPRMAHIGLLAGETERIGPWLEPWDQPAFALRDGLLKSKRDEPLSFGLVTWGNTRGLLFLAPPFPTGGYLGDHLVFVWKAGDSSKAVSLHAWEPLTEAGATLRAITMSARINLTVDSRDLLRDPARSQCVFRSTLPSLAQRSWIGLACCLACALNVGTSAGSARQMSPARQQVAASGTVDQRRSPARPIELGTGVERHRFTLKRPAGVVLLFRLTLPRGTRAYLTGRIGSVAGVGMSTDYNSCQQRGSDLVCEQAVEWCPLPRGTWGFRLHKLSGPAGTARFEFIVGAPPHR